MPSKEPSVAPSPSPEEVFLAWGPSEADMASARKAAQAMTLEEVAGQVIIARFSGRDATALSNLVTTYHLGGVAFGTSNVGTASLTRKMTAAAAAATVSDGRDWPLIIGTDQEGGTVARLAKIAPKLPTFLAAGAAVDKDRVRVAYSGAGASMVALGFNVDFAPVADVTIGLADPIIRSRSAGDDPLNVAATVVATMQGYLDASIVPAVKHFPGHGSVTGDSHHGVPVQGASIMELEDRDLVPFVAAIDAGAPMVMMSHIAVEDWGPLPTSVNPEAYAYLRDNLGFTGVVVTDSLGMGAVIHRGGKYGPGVAALLAGADLVLMPADTATAHGQIVAAVLDGVLTRERLDESAARVIAMMRYQASLGPLSNPEPDYAKDLTLAGATVATAECGTRLVGSRVTISGGYEAERDALAAALKARGVSIGGGTTVRLLGSPEGSGNADVVVAMDGPWGLPGSTATAYVGLYGRGEPSLEALADILVGAEQPGGHWPVGLTGIPYPTCPTGTFNPGI